jgi:hypothetical protein
MYVTQVQIYIRLVFSRLHAEIEALLGIMMMNDYCGPAMASIQCSTVHPAA